MIIIIEYIECRIDVDLFALKYSMKVRRIFIISSILSYINFADIWKRTTRQFEYKILAQMLKKFYYVNKYFA